MGVTGQSHPDRALFPGKDPRYPVDRRLSWAQSRYRQRLEDKSFAFAGARTPVAQSIVRHYTDWATPAPVS
jgi:hypothetical protein